LQFKNISDNQLDSDSIALAQQEREITIKVLHHLRENESRRLFSALGYRSLFEYTVKRLGYSEDQAGRRISAMRLLKELPEIEEKIESAALNLTNLGMAQTLFRTECKIKPLAKAQKLELLEKLENASTRQAERIILKASSAPAQLRPDRHRALPNNQIEVRFVAAESLLHKLEQFKGLVAHSSPDATTADLLERALDVAIQKLSPGERKLRGEREKNGNRGPAGGVDIKATPYAPQPVPPAAPQKQRAGSSSQKSSRPHLPSRIQKEVWLRAECKCQQCGSQRALQVDHIVPFAKGGPSELGNLRLLCRSCNQRAAIETFGHKKMAAHFMRPKADSICHV